MKNFESVIATQMQKKSTGKTRTVKQGRIFSNDERST